MLLRNRSHCILGKLYRKNVIKINWRQFGRTVTGRNGLNCTGLFKFFLDYLRVFTKFSILQEGDNKKKGSTYYFPLNQLKRIFFSFLNASPVKTTIISHL